MPTPASSAKDVYKRQDKLNYLAAWIDELSLSDQEKLVAIMESGCAEVSDIDDLINLTLSLIHIFRLVSNKAGCTKPFKRLWLSSLEDSAIREGFNHRRDGKEYDLSLIHISDFFHIVASHPQHPPCVPAWRPSRMAC